MFSLPLKIVVGIVLFFVALAFVPWPEIPQDALDIAHQGFQWVWWLNKYVAIDTLMARARDYVLVMFGLWILKLIMGIKDGQPNTGFENRGFYSNQKWK